MRIRPWSSWLIALALVLFVSGCGNRLVRVKGVVTMDGKPLESAMVTFMPEGSKGQSASGFTQADGSFTLSTIAGNRNGEGVWPGTYKAIVDRSDFPAPGLPGGPPVPEGITEDADLFKWQAKVQAEQRKKKSPWAKVPVKYARVNTTPFQFKVPPDTFVRLELKSEDGQ